MNTAPTPFRTKRAIKEAMQVGSRWVIETGGRGRAVTIVRASSTSRWFRFDDGRGGARASRLSVSDTKDWTVTPDGFTDAYYGERVRLITLAPAEIDHAYYERLAMPRNERDGDCAECGTPVAAMTGHIRLGHEGWEVLHGNGACRPG